MALGLVYDFLFYSYHHAMLDGIIETAKNLDAVTIYQAAAIL